MFVSGNNLGENIERTVTMWLHEDMLIKDREKNHISQERKQIWRFVTGERVMICNLIWACMKIIIYIAYCQRAPYYTVVHQPLVPSWGIYYTCIVMLVHSDGGIYNIAVYQWPSYTWNWGLEASIVTLSVTLLYKPDEQVGKGYEYVA